MTITTPAAANPIDRMRVPGEPLYRVDGPPNSPAPRLYACDRQAEARDAAYGSNINRKVGMNTTRCGVTLGQGALMGALLMTTSMATASGQEAPAVEAAAAPTLSARQQAIPLIAAAMAVSDMPRLNAALNRGLGAGLTISEAKEILVHLYAYAGFPRSLNALGELMKLLEERRRQGLQDAPGRESGAKVPTGEALLAVGTANQTRVSGAPVQGPLFDFAPVINQFLQAHLFGDIFERDNLDWRSRELATVGALAATPGAEAQLRSHMRASMNVGLTSSQLRQLVSVMQADGDVVAAERARVAFAALKSTSTK